MKLYMSYSVVTMLSYNSVVFAKTFVFFCDLFFTAIHCAVPLWVKVSCYKLRSTFCCFIWQPGFSDSSRNHFPQIWVQTSFSLICPSWRNTEVLGQKKSFWRDFSCLTKSISYSFPEKRCNHHTNVANKHTRTYSSHQIALKTVVFIAWPRLDEFSTCCSKTRYLLNMFF